MKVYSNIEQALNNLDKSLGPKSIKRAIRNAVNATMTQVKREHIIDSATADIFNIKELDVRRDISITRTSRYGVSATIKVSSKPRAAINFVVAPKQKTHWRKVKTRYKHIVETMVKKNMGSIAIPANAVGKPFIAPVRGRNGNTHIGVFIRIDKMGRNPVGAKTFWKDNDPRKLQKIKELFSIPAGGMARDKHVIDEVQKAFAEIYPRILKEKLIKQIEKRGAVSDE